MFFSFLLISAVLSGAFCVMLSCVRLCVFWYVFSIFISLLLHQEALSDFVSGRHLNHLADFGNWSVYRRAVTDDIRLCYVSAKPVSFRYAGVLPAGFESGGVVANVSYVHGAWDEVSVKTGIFEKGVVAVRISFSSSGSVVSSLDVVGNGEAWAGNVSKDIALVSLMRFSKFMFVDIIGRGFKIHCKYSLMGFTKAIVKMSSACLRAGG